MAKEDLITADYLRSILHYNPETGFFTWLHRNDDVPSWFNGKYCGTIAGANVDGYIKIKINKKPHAAHRLAWLYMTGEWPNLHIDHINGNNSDNRFCNLRDVDRCANLQNRKLNKNNAIGVQGVCFDKESGKYIAYINASRKRYYLGRFATVEDAKSARLAAKAKLHPMQPVPRD